MQCPQCRQVLITLDFSDIEVDHCIACGGIWLDAGELAHLMAQYQNEDDAYLNTVEAKRAGEKRRRCPLCRRTMTKVAGGMHGEVILDRCTQHGIWTGAGDLRKLLASEQRDGARGHLIRLLDEMFAARNKSGG